VRQRQNWNLRPRSEKSRPKGIERNQRHGGNIPQKEFPHYAPCTDGLNVIQVSKLPDPLTPMSVTRLQTQVVRYVLTDIASPVVRLRVVPELAESPITARESV
jgi:hypothetical protein